METLNSQLTRLVFLLNRSENRFELKALINAITNKINSMRDKTSKYPLEEDTNDYDFCDDILH